MSDLPQETTSRDPSREPGLREFLVPLEMPGVRARVLVAVQVETNEDCPGETHRTDKEWNRASQAISNRELAQVALRLAKTATATPHGKRFPA